MIVSYLIATCVIALLNACALSIFYRKRVNHSFIAIFFFIVLANFGSLFLVTSTTIEGVLTANKACYFGSVYLPMLEYFVVLKLCKINFPNWGKILLVICSTFIFLLSCTVGYSDIYYKSVQLISFSGVTGYIPEYGPAHNIWVLMLAGYAIANFLTIIYALKTKLNVSYKNLILFVFICIITVVSFIITGYYDCDYLIMPIVYIIDEFIMFSICLKVQMLDISDAIFESLNTENECAYIAFSEKGAYLGCNSIACKNFPEILKYQVDYSLPKKGEIALLLLNLIEEFKNHKEINTIKFSYNNRFYKVSLRSVRRNRKNHVYLFRIEDETRIQKYINQLDTNNIRLKGIIENDKNHIHAIQEQMIIGMAKIVESRDSNTGGHIKRTSRVVAIIVEEIQKNKSFNYSKEFYDALIAAAPMHDLGKIAIDDKILRKPGKFDAHEYELMKTHAEKGANIVENLLTEIESPFFVEIARNVAYYHHERFDGSGYPCSLSGNDIPFEARVMAIADVYDALVSRRCYKDKMSFESAYDFIIKSMGTQFDPELKEIFVNSREKLETYYTSLD